MRFRTCESSRVAAAAASICEKTEILSDVGVDPELPVCRQQTEKELTAAVMLLNHLVYSGLHLHTSSPVYLRHLRHAIGQAREVNLTKPADILSKLSAAGDEMLQRGCYQPRELWRHVRKHEWPAPSNASSEMREAFKATIYRGKRDQV